MTIRLLIVDDQLAVRRGLRLRLEVEADIEVVGEAANGADAVMAAELLRPDVIVMDAIMPVMGGIEAANKMRKSMPTSSIVMLSLHDDAVIRSCARDAGVVAFIAKHEADTLLLNAVRDAAANGPGVGRTQGGCGP